MEDDIAAVSGNLEMPEVARRSNKGTVDKEPPRTVATRPADLWELEHYIQSLLQAPPVRPAAGRTGM